MEQRFHAGKVLLTTSGTTALEMAALLCGSLLTALIMGVLKKPVKG